MSAHYPPTQHHRPPTSERTLTAYVGAFVFTVVVLALLANPQLTLATLATITIVTVAVRRGTRRLAAWLDGRRRSVRFPGLGTVDVRFQTH